MKYRKYTHSQSDILRTYCVYFEAILTIKKFPRWHTYERKHVLRGGYSKYLETVFA